MRKPFKFLCQKYFVRPYVGPPRRNYKGLIGSMRRENLWVNYNEDADEGQIYSQFIIYL